MQAVVGMDGEWSGPLDSLSIVAISFLLFAGDPGYRVGKARLLRDCPHFLHSLELSALSGGGCVG